MCKSIAKKKVSGERGWKLNGLPFLGMPGYTGSGGYPARPGAPPPASYGGPPPSMPPGQYPPAGGGPPFVNPPPGAGYPPPGSYMHFGPQGAAPPAPYAYPAYGAGPPRGPTQYPGYGGPPPPGGPAPSMYGPPSGQQPGPYGAYQAGAPRQGAHAQTVQYPQHQQQGPPQQGAPPPSQQAGRAPQSQQGEAGPEQRRRRFSEYKDGSSSAPQVCGLQHPYPYLAAEPLGGENSVTLALPLKSRAHCVSETPQPKFTSTFLCFICRPLA